METYHDRYIDKLKAITPIKDKTVAVLGCSFGVECRKFIENGAENVDGFDLDHRIGKDYEHPNAYYHEISITDTGMPDGWFDIVYSCAVFEHVHDLNGAMREAVRICKPGGTIFILSSPLWYSPYGNHMQAQLEMFPWCHLLFTPSELRSKMISADPSLSSNTKKLEQIIDRVYDPTYFNRLPPSAYKNAADELLGVSVVDNALWKAPPVNPEYSSVYFPMCLKKGFVESDLTTVAHFFCATKQ